MDPNDGITTEPLYTVAEDNADANGNATTRETTTTTTTTSTTNPGSTNTAGSPQSTEENKSSAFECNICFDDVSEPVVTQCGHLFCWSCIFQWLQHNASQQCPVCKAPVTEEKLIPIYGRGGSNSDPRKNRSIPQRPPGRPEQRAHPPNHQQTNNPFNDFLFGGNPYHQTNFGGVSFSAGFGLFPGLFGLHFYNNGNNQATGNNPNHPNGQRQAMDLDSSIFLSRVVFGIGLLILFFVLFN